MSHCRQRRPRETDLKSIVNAILHMASMSESGLQRPNPLRQEANHVAAQRTYTETMRSTNDAVKANIAAENERERDHAEG